jgi:hypothetical protein
MKIDKKICLFTVLMVLTLLILPIQPAKANPQFVIAEWDYPDEYGQGIEGIKMWENSTGSWVAAPYYTDLGAFYYLNYYETDYTYNWSAGASMKLRADTLLNSTLTGATDLADGQNYHRHNVTVTSGGSLIFSQEGFTYEDSGDIGAPMYYYEYYVILNFIPVDGQIYTVTVTYEVFY